MERRAADDRWQPTMMSSLTHLVIISFAAAVAVMKITIRRLLLGATLPSWSWRTEWAVASARAVIANAATYRDDPVLLKIGLLIQAPIPLQLRGKVSLRRVRIGGVKADRYTPVEAHQTDRTILYFHGGGYVFGNPGTHRQFVARLVHATGANAVASQYRLAPQHRFPAAVNDAQKAYEALIARGVQPESIVVAGDSAGGGLSIALMHRLREEGLPLPAGAMLFSPYLDLEHTSYTIRSNASTDYLPLAQLSETNNWYADEEDIRDPEASPIHADLTGLPPTLVFAGGAEMLLGDSITLAENAVRDGVDCELVIEPEMVHVWPAVVEWQDASQRTLDHAASWMARRG
ncbi:MAG: alpha/beta hydrolase [Acidimicrobiia bacterium]